jgi:hypothetical protein
LPSGETIVYPERPARYSTRTGYSLTFHRGTNITVQPNLTDKKSTISIKGMKLTKTGTTWDPTAGKIRYQFLGQKGVANLMDSVIP